MVSLVILRNVFSGWKYAVLAANGENGGKTLKYVNVVRVFRVIPRAKGTFA